MVAIYVALEKYINDKWIGIFTDSKTKNYVITNLLQRPSHTTYHHHKQLLTTIVTILRYRENLGLPTKLHKLKGQTNIRRTALADTVAKLVLTSFEENPALVNKITIILGKQAEGPHYWVMYTNNPITPPISLSTGPYSATLRPPWWTIP